MKNKIILISIFVFFLLYFNSYEKENVEFSKSDFDSEKLTEPEAEWFQNQRAFPFTDIPDGERIKSIEYVKKHMQTNVPTGSTPSWSLAGPTNIEGRITDVAIHPTNPQIVYAATANGGIWKSTNFCQTWVSMFDNQNTSSIGAIVINPSNPNILYAGTGEANSSRSTYSGTGVYKSTDAGITWNFSGLDSSFYIGRLAINPSNTQELYCAVMGYLRRKDQQRGVYKTTNGGVSWSQSLFVADSVGAIDVAIDPTTPSRVFAAMWERTRREDGYKYGGPMSALYLSTNSGGSWTILSNGFPSNNATLGRISISICASNSQIVYALAGSYNENSGKGTYKTTDGGTSWTLVNAAFGNSSSYTWYNRIIAVSPTNPNLVIAGDLYLDVSTTGGTSYTRNSSNHLDHHAITFAPSNPAMVINGTDGGIYTSTNSGTSWTRIPTLPITEFYLGDMDYNNPQVLFAGAQDNGCLRTSTGSLNDWQDLTGGDGLNTLIDYSTSQRVYASTQNGAILRSTNGGSSWFSASSGLDLTYTNWCTPFTIDKTTPLTLYAGTYKVFKSINGMQSWTTISPDMASRHAIAGSSTMFGTVTTIDAAKSDPNVVYCGTDDANVWVTTNGGTSWTKINTGLPYRWVTRVTSHPDSANVCYVTLSGYKVDSTGSHIYRTTNYGNSWTSIKGNLPDAPINDVIIDPVNYSTLYIGTDIGVMYTTNLGQNWQVLGTGFPSNVPVLDLNFHNPTRTLVAWTHGRSAFKIVVPPVGIQNNGKTIPSAFKLYQNYPNPFNPVTKIKFDIPKEGFAKIVIYDLLGREAQTILNTNMRPGAYDITFDGSNLSSGIYFYKLSVGNYTEVKKMVLVK